MGYLVPSILSVQTTSSAFCSIFVEKLWIALRAANEDLVEGNVDFEDVSLCSMLEAEREGRGGKRTELDEVADSTHDQETDTNGLGDLDELAAISCSKEPQLASTLFE